MLLPSLLLRFGIMTDIALTAASRILACEGCAGNYSWEFSFGKAVF